MKHEKSYYCWNCGETGDVEDGHYNGKRVKICSADGSMVRGIGE